MKINYLSLSIFLLIILLCCVTMIYQYRQNLDKNDILLHQPDLLKFKVKLENKKNIKENFAASLIDKYNNDYIQDNLLITDISIIEENNGKLKLIKITGTELNKIDKVYFGDFEANEANKANKEDNSKETKYYYMPNLNDPRFKSIINLDDIISLEIKLLIKEGGTDESEPVDKKKLNLKNNDPIDIKKLNIKENDLSNGYSKTIKIRFNADYNPYYEDTKYETNEETIKSGNTIHTLNVMEKKNGNAIMMYDFMTLKQIIDEDKAKINIKNICTNQSERNKNVALDNLCKKKYDDFKIYFNDITPAPTPTPELPEGGIPKLKILINKKKFDINRGENEIYFTINKDNYQDNQGNFGILEFEIDPELTDIFKNISVDLKNVEVKLINDETNVLIPTGLYLKPGLNTITTGSEGIKYDTKSWYLELKKKQNEKSSGGYKLVDSVSQFYKDTLNIITPPVEAPVEAPVEPVSYKVRDFSHKRNSDTREYEFTWKPPTALEKEANLDNFFYYFTFEPTSGDPKDNFKYSVKVPIMKEQPPTKTKSVKKEYSNKISFSYDRLLPLNSYKYSFMVSTNRPQIKILDDSQTDSIDFKPDGLDDYHTHLFDPKTGKFKLDKINQNEIRSKQPELMQTYYQMVAYNQRVAEDEIRNSQLNMADSTKCVKGHTDQFMYGDMGSAFTQNLNKFLTAHNLKEGPEFKDNQNKQEEQIENIQKKLEELEEHHGKKVSLHDLQINTLKSLQDGSLIRIEEIAGEKKLIKLNEGCVAYNKNLQYGARDDYGYVPCNLLDTEQHFTLNKINNLDEYNFLLSSNLKPRIDLNEDNKFQYPFYTIQPTDSVKCVNIEDGKFQIRPCEDNKSIKFQGFFNKDECNV